MVSVSTLWDHSDAAATEDTNLTLPEQVVKTSMSVLRYPGLVMK